MFIESFGYIANQVNMNGCQFSRRILNMSSWIFLPGGWTNIHLV